MKKPSFAAVLTLFLAVAGRSVADQLPVINPGFEEPLQAACGFNASIPGWTVTGGGVWRPLPCWSTDYPAGAPEGLQVGFTNQGDISQVLTSTLAPMIQYTLSVEVGRRGSCCPMQTYKVQLWAGTSLLAEDPGLLNPAPGTFSTSVVTFVAASDHPALGQPLEIRLVRPLGGGGQNNFDDVHLVTSSPDCPADIAPAPVGNGVVNAGDLLAVINAWGACSGGTCPADIAPAGGDGAVNVADLLAVINNWGPCQ